jgi:hypothetical protein
MRDARRVESAASRVALRCRDPSTTEVASAYRLPTTGFPRPRLSPPAPADDTSHPGRTGGDKKNSPRSFFAVRCVYGCRNQEYNLK